MLTKQGGFSDVMVHFNSEPIVAPYENVDIRVTGLKILLNSLVFSPGTRLLEVGVGEGELALLLQKKGCEIVGTNLFSTEWGYEDQVLKAAHNIEVLSASAESLPFEEGSFDVLFCSHVLEHCPNPGLVLSELFRVLKKEGTLLIAVPPHQDRVCVGHISMVSIPVQRGG